MTDTTRPDPHQDLVDRDTMGDDYPDDEPRCTVCGDREGVTDPFISGQPAGSEAHTRCATLGLPQVMMTVEPADDDERRVYEAAVYYRNTDGTVERLADWTHQTFEAAVEWIHATPAGEHIVSALYGTITTLRRHTITWHAPAGPVTETFWQPVHFNGYLYNVTLGRLDHATSEVVS